MKLFDPEGPLMTALGTLADLVFCNILFCLLSLPVVTAGASLCALYDCTMSIVEEREETFLPGQFWRAFRRNFRRGTALWLCALAAMAVLWAYSAAVNTLAVSTLSGGLTAMYRVTFFVLLFLFLAGFQYLFPLQARESRRAMDAVPDGKGERPKRGLFSVIKTAYLLSAAALPWTLCMLAVTVGMVFLTFFLRPEGFGTALYLWAFALFAVTAYLHSFFLRLAFRRLERLG